MVLHEAGSTDDQRRLLLGPIEYGQLVRRGRDHTAVSAAVEKWKDSRGFRSLYYGALEQATDVYVSYPISEAAWARPPSVNDEWLHSQVLVLATGTVPHKDVSYRQVIIGGTLSTPTTLYPADLALRLCPQRLCPQRTDMIYDPENVRYRAFNAWVVRGKFSAPSVFRRSNICWRRGDG